MMCSVSFHRILSLEESNPDDIECIDEVDSENAHSRCNLSSDDNSTGCKDKSKHNGARITYETRSLGIESSHEKCRWNNNRQEGEEKF